MDNLDIFKDLPLLKTEFLGNSIYNYILTLCTFVALCAIFYGVRYVLAKRLEKLAAQHPAQKFTSLILFLRELLRSIKFWLVSIVLFSVALQRLTISDTASRTLKYVTITLIAIQVTRLIIEVVTYIIANSRFSSSNKDDLAVRNSTQNLATIARIVLWAGCILFLLDNFGINISTFVAGLGIGGIAIALAAQALLGDAFSSFAISMDKPFEVGDYINIDNMNGTVEHIGLKTTRVRSLGGELLVFGNSDLTKARIRNFKKMARRRADFRIGVTYETKYESIEALPRLLKEIVESVEKATFERAHFSKYDESALTFEVVYYVESPEYAVFMDIQQAINLKIHKVFTREGIDMAFPTRTIKLQGDVLKAVTADAGASV